MAGGRLDTRQWLRHERDKKENRRSYPAAEEQKQELMQWYTELIEMMRRENVQEKGHLQVNKNDCMAHRFASSFVAFR